jgi:hypothetical protein
MVKTTVHLIVYGADAAGKRSSSVSDEIASLVADRGTSHCLVMPGVWAVASSLPVSAWWLALREALGQDEAVLVTTLGRPFHGWLDRDVLDWLERQVPAES